MGMARLGVVARGGRAAVGVAGAARGGAGGGRAVVAAAAAGGALRGAGRARAAVPVPAGLGEGDGGAHGGGLLQAHVAAHLPQRAPPRPRLLPLLAEDLRCVPPRRRPCIHTHTYTYALCKNSISASISAWLNCSSFWAVLVASAC